jgi:hypothetical protein|tara:strand:- start:506 stop:799 length:294 start_codon:yes stop_codon:yes gene_type:complete
MGMDLNNLRDIVVLIGFVALIGAATAIALDAFQGEQVDGTATCNATDKSDCGYAYNISNNGLQGINNSTGFMDTIGTIAGVAVLIGIVVLAFVSVKR